MDAEARRRAEELAQKIYDGLENPAEIEDALERFVVDAVARAVEGERQRAMSIVQVFRSCEFHVYPKEHGCQKCTEGRIMGDKMLAALRAPGEKA